MFTPDVLDLFDFLLKQQSLAVGGDDFDKAVVVIMKAKKQLAAARPKPKTPAAKPTATGGNRATRRAAAKRK